MVSKKPCSASGGKGLCVHSTGFGQVWESSSIPSCTNSPRLLPKGIRGVSRHLTGGGDDDMGSGEGQVRFWLTAGIRDSKDFQSGPHSRLKDGRPEKWKEAAPTVAFRTCFVLRKHQGNRQLTRQHHQAATTRRGVCVRLPQLHATPLAPRQEAGT